MANRICKLKTYKALMKGMHRELTNFLSCKECAIMFYDQEKKKLFTISMDQNDDDLDEGGGPVIVKRDAKG